jgi:hypothetical protein
MYVIKRQGLCLAVCRICLTALGMTARKLGSKIRTAVRKDIRSSGDFGKAWDNAVRVDTVPKRGPAAGLATITTRYSSSPLGRYAQAFQEGAAIHGKPMLWIPLSYTGLRMRVEIRATIRWIVRSQTRRRTAVAAIDQRQTPEVFWHHPSYVAQAIPYRHGRASAGDLRRHARPRE